MRNYYTTAELADKLKISTRTVLREISRGKLKPVKAGRKFLFSPESLENYLAGQTADKAVLVNFFLKRQNEMISLLQRLVALPSTTETKNCEKTARFLQDFLSRQGIRSSIIGRGESASLHAVFGFAEAGLLFNAPLDTAPAGDPALWHYPAFAGIVRHGRLYGRGAADARAGIVCMIYAILALKELINEDNVRLELVFDGGEHGGAFLGMKEILKQGLDVSAGVIGYGGDANELIIGARGYHRYTFTLSGQARHTGSRTKETDNAIEKAARLALSLSNLAFPAPRDPLFAFGSKATVTQIEGGRAINVVPDSCRLKLDIRATPDLRRPQVEQMLKQIINQLSKQNPRFRAEQTYDLGQEGYKLSHNEKIISSAQNAISRALGIKPEIVVSGPAHIGNLLFEQKIPVIVYGPAGDNVHAYDEYVEISSLPQTAEIYTRLALEYFDVPEF